ncbi:hypothetical protein HK405_007222 [Cladochytrium tenue]|nr:hypothetical protein HK405_007222 [Cladochytrium tenue]
MNSPSELDEYALSEDADGCPGSVPLFTESSALARPPLPTRDGAPDDERSRKARKPVGHNLAPLLSALKTRPQNVQLQLSRLLRAVAATAPIEFFEGLAVSIKTTLESLEATRGKEAADTIAAHARNFLSTLASDGAEGKTTSVGSSQADIEFRPTLPPSAAPPQSLFSWLKSPFAPSTTATATSVSSSATTALAAPVEPANHSRLLPMEDPAPAVPGAPLSRGSVALVVLREMAKEAAAVLVARRRVLPLPPSVDDIAGDEDGSFCYDESSGGGVANDGGLSETDEEKEEEEEGGVREPVPAWGDEVEFESGLSVPLDKADSGADVSTPAATAAAVASKEPGPVSPVLQPSEPAAAAAR